MPSSIFNTYSISTIVSYIQELFDAKIRARISLDERGNVAVEFQQLNVISIQSAYTVISNGPDLDDRHKRKTFAPCLKYGGLNAS